jgi:tricarballylate dehydrogenase
MTGPGADVVVVGGGVAGLSAAAAALQGGASVILLERSGPEDRGGQTRWTESLMRMKSENEVSDDFADHFMENASHYLDPSLLREVTGAFEQRSSIVKALSFSDPEMLGALVERAGPTIQWLKSFGLRFDFLPTYFLTTSQPRMAPVGGGRAIVEALGAWIEKHGARVHFHTAAHRLLQDDAGAICGVRARGADGRVFDIKARSTVLACGGFEGNPEMLIRYVGPDARYIRPVARGGYYNKGEGIRMALEVGAAPCGDFSSFHAEPLDPRSGAPEPIVLVFNYGILVNRDGRRFIDEAPATVDATYESITRVILRQPEGIAYVVLDSRIDDVPGWRRAVRSDQPPIMADSLAALAAQIGVNAEALAHTVADFNAACPLDAGFKPLELDGLATSQSYAPRKSNWSRRIDRAPFLAYPIICGNCFTFGGIKTDAKARVLDSNGGPIQGLYAAGEMTGIYYRTYTGATSVLRGAVFGHIAGADAAQSGASQSTARPMLGAQS